MARTQTRAITALRAALLRVLRSRALHRALTVVGLVAVGWLIGGAAQANAETAQPVDTASQTVSTVLHAAADLDGTAVPQAHPTVESVRKTASAFPNTAAAAESAPRSVPVHKAVPDPTATAVKAVPDLVAAGKAVTDTVATAGNAVPQTLETARDAVPGAVATAADAVPRNAGPARDAVAGDGSWTPRSQHRTAARAHEPAVTGASKTQVAKKKAVHKKTRPTHEAAERHLPQAPASYMAGALPPAVNGGGVVAGGWVALPQRRHGSSAARRLVLVLAPRLGAGLPPVNSVVDEPSFSPD